MVHAVTALLAAACIVLGFVGYAANEQLLMPGLAWFVLAIALNTLDFDIDFGNRHAQ